MKNIKLKRFIKYFAVTVLFCLSLFALSGCLGTGGTFLLFLNDCGYDPGDRPLARDAALDNLCSLSYVQFTSETAGMGYRIADGYSGNGWGYITYKGERREAYFEQDGYFTLEVYACFEEDGIGSLDLAYSFSAHFYDGSIMIDDTNYSYGSERFINVTFSRSDITDKTVFLPHERAVLYTDGNELLNLRSTGDTRRYLLGSAYVVSSGKDYTVKVAAYFNADGTFVFRDNSTGYINYNAQIIASGTFTVGDTGALTLVFAEDGIFKDETAQGQFADYPTVKLTDA